MNEIELRQAVVNTVKSWDGLNEADGTHKKIIDIYNSYMPHPRSHKLLLTDSWCAATVSAVAIVTKLTNIIPVECSCNEMITLFKNHKYSRFEENDSYDAQIADIIFYDWDDDGKGENIGAPEHVGIITAKTATSFEVYEGNNSNAVKSRDVLKNGKFIRGFGLPKYDLQIDMSFTEAKALIKQKTEFTDDTMKFFFDYYKFGESAAIRLAKLLKGV